MKVDSVMKALLAVIAVLLFLNLVSTSFFSGPAHADEALRAGRYQISAWAASIGTYGHHSGYFVLDTATGKVTDSHEEAHDITKTP